MVQPKDAAPVRLVRDALAHLGALAVLVVVLVVFLGGAFAGLQMIDRLGSIGLAMYAVALLAWGLLFVPLVAYAHRLRQSGSPRHRKALRERQEHQMLHYGVEARERGDDPAR
ncbi:hypothetical protein [Conexibacter sp. SYSU D00693]|uniref:hypothetical protein n=1 Tax=Conexibacter sp. SYSU D00693 TaxID=2812560 RepID=UPI00196AA672|nr:hypothetical protein [Conexibacter sp. SYSU D00693]